MSQNPPAPARTLAPLALRPGLLALFADSGALRALFLAMVLLAVVAGAGLVLDPRVITGAPAWLKPLKFAVSVALYAASFAWLSRHLEHRAWSRRANRATAALLALELVLIFLQAARGTTSHFNKATWFDAAVFQTMGVAILALWCVQVATTLALLRQPFADPLLAATLRSAMALTALGAAVGFFMVVPRPDQLAHGVPTLIGSHTIGAPDGGPGLPLVGWSRQHGDLRAAHFLGLHALQILPLVAWLVSRPALRLLPRQQLGLLRTAAAGLAGLLAILLWQALRGQPLVAPDAATFVALGLWLLGTSVAASGSLARRRHAAPLGAIGMSGLGLS